MKPNVFLGKRHTSFRVDEIAINSYKYYLKFVLKSDSNLPLHHYFKTRNFKRPFAVKKALKGIKFELRMENFFSNLENFCQP